MLKKADHVSDSSSSSSRGYAVSSSVLCALSLQGLLQRLSSATQAFNFRALSEHPAAARHIAEATVNTGTHEQLLRAAVAAIVRPSSRCRLLHNIFSTPTLLFMPYLPFLCILLSPADIAFQFLLLRLILLHCLPIADRLHQTM